MNRRDFLSLTAAAATLAVPLGALAQATLRRPLVGYLSIVTPDAEGERLDAFRKTMKSLGWVEGINYLLEVRSTLGINDRLVSTANELISMKPDVLVGEGARGASTLGEATSTVPVVGPSMAEQTAVDFAGSNFAHPKANVTGILVSTSTNVGKQFQLAAELVPAAKRYAFLRDTFIADLSAAQVPAAALSLGVDLVIVDATVPADLPGAVRKCVDAGAQVAISEGALFNSEQEQLVGLMAFARLPAVYAYAASVRIGGLAAYGSDLSYNYRRGAEYVDGILKGTKPGDLPIVVPSPVKTINLQTAGSLGLSVSPSVLATADEIVGA